VIVSRDNSKLYVVVGSNSNGAENGGGWAINERDELGSDVGPDYMTPSARAASTAGPSGAYT